MTLGAEDERLRPSDADGFADSVTFSWGDADARAFGMARIGIAPGDPPSASALAVLFDGGEMAAVQAVGGEAIEAGADWPEIEAAGVRAEVLEPLEAWRVAFEGDGGSFDLRFEAHGPAALFGPESDAARAGGVEGYEHVCMVSGTATVGGQAREVRCRGQRGHGWGVVDWDRMETARTVSAWLEDDRSVLVSAVRPAGVEGHGEEAVTGFLIEGSEPVALKDARLSSTYDAEGRQRRAGLELWPEAESAFPLRASGDVLCGTSLDLGRLRLDCAFFGWRMEGAAGVGRYDLLRRQ